VDIALHRLCLTRSRNEAKVACDAGAVLVDGKPAKASQLLAPGQVVVVRYPRRLLELRLLQLPPKSTSKQLARTMYEVIRDEHLSEV
jgi:ribosomal 50S subunit-recycling heat shock protein